MLCYNQLYILIYPLFWIFFSFTLPQSTEQNSLCYLVGSHWLPIFYILQFIHTYVNANLPLTPSWYLYICSLLLHLCFCFANKIMPFFDSFNKIQFSYHKIYTFEVYSSVVFNVFTELSNHQLYVIADLQMFLMLIQSKLSLFFLVFCFILSNICLLQATDYLLCFILKCMF